MPSWVSEHFRTDFLPHIWCAGCGNGIAVGALVRALDAVGADPDRTTVVSGIGCSSRAPGYLDYDTLHTTHGRALAFATGVKLARPELRVVVVAGDGDLAAIGGNHLIHAARRNIDITVLCMNNSIYGMTGGQFSPMTPTGKTATTAPYGTIDRPFDLCELVRAAGGTYVARSTTYHAAQLERLLRRALEHDGFGFVETATQCPTYYGRRNQLKSPADMLDQFKHQAVSTAEARQMTPEQLADRIVIGELFVGQAPEYVAEYEASVRRARGEGER